MLNWFVTSWSDSDSFKIGVCVAAAAVAALSFSDRRSSILRPLVGFVTLLFGLPARLIKRNPRPVASAILLDDVKSEKMSFSITVDPNPPTQQELADWIGEIRPGCLVSFVEELGDEQAVHQGTITSITDDLAWIVWNVGANDHPFTSGPGPDGRSESEHNVELILKEHKLGDRGVTWDPSGVVLVANGWSVISWPKFTRPA